MKEERVRTGRLARMGSIFFLLLSVVACSNTATPSPTVVTSSAVPPTPSAIPTPSPTASPLPTATPSPHPMAPATLKPGPKMTVAREGQVAVRADDGRVLIMGGTIPFTGKCGMGCVDPATASVEIYDPKTGKFSPAGSLAEPRTGGHALLLNDGRVLVSGGSGLYGNLNTIEIHDPARGTSIVAKSPAAGPELPFDPTVALLADGRVLIAGGSYDGLTTTSTATLIFDPGSVGFSKGPLMAKPREGATATLLDDGRVLIVGGQDLEGGYGSANNNAELIDPAHPLSQSTLLACQGYAATPTLLSDGRVLVAGGGSYDSATGLTDPTFPEVLDPRTDRFAPVGQMSMPRTGLAAIKVKDGRVLLFGGVDSKAADVGTVEAFDPDSGTFQVVATGFPDIRDFSATLLDDGEILIAGGWTQVDAGSGYGSAFTAASWFLKP
jgi:hypothetical protein